MDSVSTMGYGLGYIGGSTIPLLIFLIMNAVGIPMLTCLGIIFAITAVWWLVFSLPLLKKLPADFRQTLREGGHRPQHPGRLYHHPGDHRRQTHARLHCGLLLLY